MSASPRIIFSLLTLTLGLASAPAATRAAFTVQGDLPDSFERQVVALEREWLEERSTEPVARGVVEGGRFSLRADASPGLYRLRIGEMETPFVAGRDQTLQVGTAEGKLRIGGGPDQDLFLAYEAVRAESLGRLVLKVREAIRAARAAGDEARAERLTEDEVSGYQAHRRELNDFTLTRLAGSPALYAASLRWDGDHRLPELAGLVRAYAAKNPDDEIGRRMADRIARFEATAIGATAPALAGPMPDGRTLDLSALRGKYVLIDFWASWCPPCRTENRHYRELYAQYRAKGFEILAVSVDQNGPAWRAAIAADQAVWLHLSDLTGWKTPLAARYNVSALPASFLLDPEGRIVAKDARGERLTALLAKHLGEAR